MLLFLWREGEQSARLWKERLGFQHVPCRLVSVLFWAPQDLEGQSVQYSQLISIHGTVHSIPHLYTGPLHLLALQMKEIG
jgi:hypothetical protein